MDTTLVLTMFVGTVVPIFNGLLTRYDASTARAYLQLVLNAAAGFGAEWLDALNSGAAYDVKQAALGSLLALVASVATQAGVWAPTGVSDWAKRTAVK